MDTKVEPLEPLVNAKVQSDAEVAFDRFCERSSQSLATGHDPVLVLGYPPAALRAAAVKPGW